MSTVNAVSTPTTPPGPPRGSSPRPGRRRSGNRTLAPYLLVAPFMLLFLMTFVVPILVALVQSFTRTRYAGTYGQEGTTQELAGLDNYATALGNASFTQSIGRVLLFGVVQVSIMIAAATVLALLLESASARWPGLFRALYFMPYGVPGVIATILWSFLYIPGLSPVVDALGVVGVQYDFLAEGNVLWSIANIVTWAYTGYNMLIIIAQLKAIPSDVYEAAKVDGAGPLRIATSIQIPLIRPALLLTIVFSIIGTLQLFAEPQVLATITPAVDTEYTPNYSAYTWAFQYNDYGVAAAEAVIIAVTAFALSFAFLAATTRPTSRRGGR